MGILPDPRGQVFGTECGVELHALPCRARQRTRSIAGYLLVAEKDLSRAVRVNLSSNLFPFSLAICEWADEVTDELLERFGSRSIATSKEDLQLCYQRFADKWGIDDYFDIDYQDFCDHKRSINRELVAFGLPPLVIGGTVMGFSFDTHPRNIRIVEPPHFGVGHE